MNLTLEQKQSLDRGEPVSIRVDETECVVLRNDVYERIKGILYVDSPVANEESIRLAWEAGRSIGWETPEMAEYDDYHHRAAL